MGKTVQDILNDYKNGSISDTDIVNDISVADDNIEEVDGFEIIFNAPTIINTKLIFSASITNKTGVMFNGNMQLSANVSNEDPKTVKFILETIKNDTIAAMNQLDANKDWYK